MKFSPPQSLRRATQIAERVYEKAEVESAYDSHGHLKFLMARIPRAEFTRLYGQSTFATIFHRGHWIEFARHGRSIAIHERTTGSRFHLDLRANGFGWAQLRLQRKNKAVWKQTLTPEDLEGFEMDHDLLQQVAKVCARRARAQAPYSDCGMFQGDVASIHILPECDEGPEFSSALVELQ